MIDGDIHVSALASEFRDQQTIKGIVGEFEIRFGSRLGYGSGRRRYGYGMYDRTRWRGAAREDQYDYGPRRAASMCFLDHS